LRKSYTIGDYLYEIDTWEKDVFPLPYLEIEILKKKGKLKEGLEQIFSKKEIKKLILSKDSITELKEMYEKSTNNVFKVLYAEEYNKK
jgi:adenylate cyclase class 2